MKNNYVEKLLKNDSREIYKLTFISQVAIDMIIDGINLKKEGKLEEAKYSFAFAWVFHSLQEYEKGMVLSDRLLRNLDVNKYRLNELHEYGRGIVEYCMNMVSSVDRALGKKDIFGFNAPFELE